MELQLRADDNNRATGIVHAFSEQILPESSLLTFERVRERLQRPVVRATQNATAATVVKQCIDRRLKHALFIADDDVRSMQLHELLQTVVAVDNAAVEII